jgi:hypothetical protein
MTAASEPSEASSGNDSPTRRYARAGLELVGLQANESEMAVIEGADALYRPLIVALMDAELDDIEPEPGEDMSGPPRSVERR